MSIVISNKDKFYKSLFFLKEILYTLLKPSLYILKCTNRWRKLGLQCGRRIAMN